MQLSTVTFLVRFTSIVVTLLLAAIALAYLRTNHYWAAAFEFALSLMVWLTRYREVW